MFLLFWVFMAACGLQSLWRTGLIAPRNLPRPGIEPVSPALAGRFLTTGPPGKSMYLSELEFSPDVCPGVESLDHVVVLFLVFEETSLLFFVVAVLIYIASGVGRFPFLHTSASFSWHGCLLGNFSLVSGLWWRLGTHPDLLRWCAIKHRQSNEMVLPLEQTLTPFPPEVASPAHPHQNPPLLPA